MTRMARRLSRWLTGPMLLSFAVFGSMPLWIEHVGLYQYLGVEIMIWVIFALAVNLLLGYTGLPSFGHGAFLGIGAYAFGLTQFELLDNLWVALAGAVIVTSYAHDKAPSESAPAAPCGSLICSTSASIRSRMWSS